MHLVDTVKKHLLKIKNRFTQHYQSGTPDNKIIAWLNKPSSINLSEHWTNKILDVDEILIGINPKSTTLKWIGTDNEGAFNSLGQQGPHWKFTKENVHYSFNSFGYRGDEPIGNSDYTVMVLGDSHTFGTGLNDDDVWPEQFKKLLQQQYPKCRVINFAVQGCSNDAMARILSCGIDTIKPDCVIVCYTYPNRREAIWDSGNIWQLNMSLPNGLKQSDYDEFQSWFMTINEHTDYYNWMKNHKFIQALCKDITLIESQVSQMAVIQRKLGTVLQYNDVARDCKHFGPAVHSEFAKNMYNKFCTRQNNHKNVK